jgi:hypothetical protein
VNAKQLRAKNAKTKKRYGPNLLPRVSDAELEKMMKDKGAKVEKKGKK